MLAYVFWHWPRHGIDLLQYERGLVSFHETLRERAPKGFVGALTYRVTEAPWVEDVRPAYEDWYLLTGSAALDVLNEAAVTGASQARHDGVAQHAAGGAAGLYRLRGGSAELQHARTGMWLSKPEGMSYDVFRREIEPALGNAVGLWGRQMVLGPTPEFCLMAPEPVAVAHAVAVAVPHELMWASISAR